MPSSSETPVPPATAPDPAATQAAHASVVAICAAVLPVWSRHLAAARSQSEAAVTEMLAAFAEIGPHLDRAARQSEQITAALAQGEGGITHLAQACQSELAPLIASVDRESANTIGRVITMIQRTVHALEQIAEPFDHETRMVSQQVDRMYVGFQYQDRINQLMSLLYEDIGRLSALAQAPLADEATLATDDWLARLESQYAMAEQRHGHKATTSDGTSPRPGDDVETIFF